MRARTKLAVALALAALALVVGLRLRANDGARSSASGAHSAADAASAAKRLRFDWRRGSEIRYALEWQGETLTRPPVAGATQDALAGKTSLSAQVTLRSYGLEDQAYLLAVSLTRVSKQSFTIMGKSVFADDAAANKTLLDRPAYVEITDQGEIRRLRFERTDPLAFKEIMRAIVVQMGASFPADAAIGWTTVEAGPVGAVKSRYDVDPEGALKMKRKRLTYVTLANFPPPPAGVQDAQTLDGEADIELSAAGHLRALSNRESILVNRGPGPPMLVARSTFAVNEESVGRFEPSDIDLARLEAIRPDEPFDSSDADRELLEQQTQKLTLEQLLVDFDTLAKVGTVPEAQRWFGRAVALLKLHPEMADAVVKAFTSTTMTPRGRPMLLNLLAVAGHARAQAAMREALKSAAAHEPRDGYVKLLQYVSMIEKPDAETAAFVSNTYESARARNGDSALRNGSAYVLGAVAQEMAKSNPELARETNARLERDLKNARSSDDRVALLAALGNTKREENVAVFRESAKDADLAVRRQVATSLRNATSHDGRALLVELASDAQTAVAATAFHSMETAKLDGSDLEALAEAVLAGRTAAAADTSLVSMLAGHLDGGAPVRNMLLFLLERNRHRRELVAKIDLMLASVY